MKLSLNQRIQTPKGPASFVGVLFEQGKIIVSRMVPATELSKEECIARKPIISEWQHIEFINWQRTAKFCINETYAVEDVKVM
jgi:hypothetical protein